MNAELGDPHENVEDHPTGRLHLCLNEIAHPGKPTQTIIHPLAPASYLALASQTFAPYALAPQKQRAARRRPKTHIIMFNLPNYQEITAKADRLDFAKSYTACSGLPVPEAFILSPTNQVFGLFVKRQLIGGFILGHGPAFRTIAVFANEDQQPALYQQFSEADNCTEICCFFIAPEYRLKTFYNFATWASMIYAQVRHGRKNFLFGTCSRSLAKLYGQTKKSVLIHEDVVNGKSTFIFWAEKRYCIGGMLKIMSHKLQRIIQVAKRGKRRMVRS